MVIHIPKRTTATGFNITNEERRSGRFKCDRDALSEALQTVQRAVSSRPGIPALTGVLMNASGTELVLATTDLEVSARLRLEVQVQEEGVALIPARLLADMVKSFEQAPVIVEADGGQARIVCSNYEGTVRCLPAEDFPALQDPGGTRVTVDAAGFAEVSEFRLQWCRRNQQPGE